MSKTYLSSKLESLRISIKNEVFAAFADEIEKVRSEIFEVHSAIEKCNKRCETIEGKVGQLGR